MIIKISKRANIILVVIWLIFGFLGFYYACSQQRKLRESYRVYKESASYYISGNAFKITEISTGRCCMYIKPDSVDLKRIPSDLYSFTGVYDKEKHIVLLSVYLFYVNEEKTKYIEEKKPYIIAKFDSRNKIDTIIFPKDEYKLRINIVSNQFYGDFLSKQMDTMSNAIKF